MIQFTVTVDPPLSTVLDKLPDGPAREEAMDWVLDQGRFIVMRNIMARMPDTGTGNMRRRTTTDHTHLHAEVRVEAGYAKFPDQGVVPHPIAPRMATMLRFVMGGAKNAEHARRSGQARRGHESAYVFASLVHHPGQPAQHFMEGGLQDSLDAFGALVRQGAERMLGGPGA